MACDTQDHANMMDGVVTDSLQQMNYRGLRDRNNVKN